MMAVMSVSIIAISAYQSLSTGQLDSQWGVFTGLVIGYYFRGSTPAA